jgi:hypothetical protein
VPGWPWRTPSLPQKSPAPGQVGPPLELEEEPLPPVALALAAPEVPLAVEPEPPAAPEVAALWLEAPAEPLEVLDG